MNKFGSLIFRATVFVSFMNFKHNLKMANMSRGVYHQAQQHSGNVRGFLLHCFQRCEFDPRDVQQLFGTPFSKVSLR